MFVSEYDNKTDNRIIMTQLMSMRYESRRRKSRNLTLTKINSILDRISKLVVFLKYMIHLDLDGSMRILFKTGKTYSLRIYIYHVQIMLTEL